MTRVDFFVRAFMDGLQSAEAKAAKMGIAGDKIITWKSQLQGALSA